METFIDSLLNIAGAAVGLFIIVAGYSIIETIIKEQKENNKKI